MFSKIILLLSCTAFANAGLASTGQSTSSRAQDYAGNNQFGYSIQDAYGVNGRTEKSDAYNNRIGSYTITGADGRVRRVDYIADAHGFRARVNTNEPGTQSSYTAGAFYTAPKATYTAAVAAPVAKVAAPAFVSPAFAAPVAKVAAPAFVSPAFAAPVAKVAAPAFVSPAFAAPVTKVAAPAFVSPAFAAPVAKVAAPTYGAIGAGPTLAASYGVPNFGAHVAKVAAPAFTNTIVTKVDAPIAAYGYAGHY